jgi:PEP-CTERM motif
LEDILKIHMLLRSLDKCALGVALLAGFTVVPGFGSTINFLAPDPSTSTTVTEDNFAVFGNTMGPMLITAKFADGSTPSCNWAAGVGTSGCTSASNFSIGFQSGADTDPDVSGAAVWTITDLKSTSSIVSLTIDALAGNVAFDRCLKTGGFDDTNNGGTVCTIAAGGIEGTPNSAEGWSVGSGAGGTAGIAANAQYSNILHVAGSSPVGDAWGFLTLTFTGTSFTSGDTFTFRADTDIVTSKTADVPEPGTLGFIGAGLAGLGAMRSRKRATDVKQS